MSQETDKTLNTGDLDRFHTIISPETGKIVHYRPVVNKYTESIGHAMFGYIVNKYNSDYPIDFERRVDSILISSSPFDFIAAQTVLVLEGVLPAPTKTHEILLRPEAVDNTALASVVKESIERKRFNQLFPEKWLLDAGGFLNIRADYVLQATSYAHPESSFDDNKRVDIVRQGKTRRFWYDIRHVLFNGYVEENVVNAELNTPKLSKMARQMLETAHNRIKPEWPHSNQFIAYNTPL